MNQLIISRRCWQLCENVRALAERKHGSVVRPQFLFPSLFKEMGHSIYRLLATPTAKWSSDRIDLLAKDVGDFRKIDASTLTAHLYGNPPEG